MNMMDMAATSRLALTGQSPWPQPLAYLEDVQRANLDGSVDSLERIDRLLTTLHLREQPDAASFERLAGGESLLVLLCVALGLVIERETGLPIEWLDWEQGAKRHPPDHPLPNERWARLVGIMVDSPLVPLGLLESLLFEGDQSMTCQQYVQRVLARTQERAQAAVQEVDQNERCAQYLQALAVGGEPPYGLSYRKALQQAQPDFSSASLARLDQLLAQIRTQHQPRYEEFLREPANQNFVRMVAFYAAMCTARIGQLPIKWLNFNEARALLNEIDFQFETTCVCLLDNRWFFPLGLVTEILLQPEPERTISGWSKGVLQTASPPIVSIRRADARKPPPVALEQNWIAATQEAGRHAAMCLFMVEGGSTLTPQLVMPKQGGGIVINQMGMGADQWAYQESERALTANPDKHPWQLRATDGYANLWSGRTDAITLELRCYAGGMLSRRKPLELTVVCPYRNAAHAQGFAIWSPKLFTCSEPADAASRLALAHHFYKGIDGFQLPKDQTSFSWSRYLDESV